MNFTHRIEKILTDYPESRERRFRWRVIGSMLKESYPHELGNVDLARIWDMISDGISIERLIRDAQQNNEKWRGSDYEDKEVLSQEYQLKVLKKESGFSGNVKKLSKIK